ncbi:unnamed protein product [Tilletia caries]|nr:unnamed protein product [Tilletia caries]
MTTEALRATLSIKVQDYRRLMSAVTVLKDGLEHLTPHGSAALAALLRSADERLAEAQAIIDELERTQIRLGPSTLHPGGPR